jgi:hypothetical protein
MTDVGEALEGERRTLTQGEVLRRAGEVAREFCVAVRGS